MSRIPKQRMARQFMTTDEAAQILNRSRQTVIDLIKAGAIEAIDASTPAETRPVYRIPAEAFTRFLAGRNVKVGVAVTEGGKLKAARLCMGWTISEVSARVGISYFTLARIESGQIAPGKPVLEALRRELLMEP